MPAHDMSYLDEHKVAVWLGSLESKDQVYAYFNLPDQMPPDEDADYQNPFAEDYKIEFYEDEFTAYNLTRAMRPKSVAELIEPIPMPKGLRRAIVEAASQKGVAEGNVVFVAFRFDYEIVRSRLRDKPASRHEFHYVGTFDNS